MLLIIGSAMYWGFGVLDFIISMKARKQGHREWLSFMRDKDGLFAPVRNIIATVAIYVLAIVLALNITDDKMGYALGFIGVARLIGAGFNYSKTK